ncbi:MAG: SOUL family heme-binding protein [Burkholderiaceae bacterium]
MKHLAALAATIVLGLLSPMAIAIEEPKYTVVREYDGFEIREYSPYLVAEVVVPGPAEEAGNQGFRVLSSYIFGKNRGERKISMTAPVAQAPASAKIEMTVPVTQAAANGAYVVQFTMPSDYTLETLPEPLDPQVKLKEAAGGRFAVIRYSGSWYERNFTEHLEKLERAVEAAGLSTTGSPIYCRYNAPFVPWFMRRNEIWLKLV